jgi:hypothetical protein
MPATAELLGRISRRLNARNISAFKNVLAVGLVVASGWLILRVTTQKFYTAERTPIRFGTGVSRIMIPLDGCRWIAEHDAPGRLWCDYDSSSNLHWFTGRRDVPILTNTWAYPPEIMRQVLDVNGGVRPIKPLLDSLEVGTVLLRIDRMTAPVARLLTQDQEWALVTLSPIHGVWVRRAKFAGPLEELTEEFQFTAMPAFRHRV